jgi:hypothetical protein
MAKLFCVSDIHSFYDELKKALDEAGFDPENENHWLIVCGDCFDRGAQPVEVMRYLQGLSRKVLIKGNHESLLQDLCERGYPGGHDYSNGTYDTVCEFGGAGEGRCFEECCIITEQRTKSFIYSMVPYFETRNYVFVHGWIPVICQDGFPMHYRQNRKFEFNPDWRTAHYSEWEQASWLNGIDMARKGFVESGKTIVCGHWHCSYGYMLDSIKTDNWISEFEEDAIWDPYYSDGIIAIDRCTAHTGEVNVLVLEDEFLENTP